MRLNAKCLAVRKQGKELTATLDCTSGSPEVSGSHLLLAVGRRPNTDDVGLDKAGVSVDQHGYIEVDDELRTNVPGIWAMGDCNGKGAFTHTAYNDYEIVAANILDKDPRRVTDRIPAYALYIDPPLGRAGMSETEVRSAGKPALVGKRPMTKVSRAIEKGETQGFMKIVIAADTKQILGAAILGTGGDEVVHSPHVEISQRGVAAVGDDSGGKLRFQREIRVSLPVVPEAVVGLVGRDDGGVGPTRIFGIVDLGVLEHRHQAG